MPHREPEDERREARHGDDHRVAEQQVGAVAGPQDARRSGPGATGGGRPSRGSGAGSSARQRRRAPRRRNPGRPAPGRRAWHRQRGDHPVGPQPRIGAAATSCCMRANAGKSTSCAGTATWLNGQQHQVVGDRVGAERGRADDAADQDVVGVAAEVEDSRAPNTFPRSRRGRGGSAASR